MKLGTFALIAFLGVSLLPPVAAAEESVDYRRSRVCTSGNYGQLECKDRWDKTTRTWETLQIAYLDTTSISEAVIHNTALDTQTKVLLGSIFTAGVLGLLLKLRRSAH
jgi:hypothetical protein